MLWLLDIMFLYICISLAMEDLPFSFCFAMCSGLTRGSGQGSESWILRTHAELSSFFLAHKIKKNLLLSDTLYLQLLWHNHSQHYLLSSDGVSAIQYIIQIYITYSYTWTVTSKRKEGKSVSISLTRALLLFVHVTVCEWAVISRSFTYR